MGRSLYQSLTIFAHLSTEILSWFEEYVEDDLPAFQANLELKAEIKF